MSKRKKPKIAFKEFGRKVDHKCLSSRCNRNREFF